MQTTTDHARELQAGTRFYYTGDMANQSGAGVIERRDDSGRWGVNLWLRFDDQDREPFCVSPASFSPSPGRRFYPEPEWLELRRRHIEEMEIQYRAVVERGEVER